MGLVHELCPENQLKEKAAVISEQVLANSPSAIKAAKLLIHNIAHKSPGKETLDITCEKIADIRISKEGQEGVAAFLGKKGAVMEKALAHSRPIKKLLIANRGEIACRIIKTAKKNGY